MNHLFSKMLGKKVSESKESSILNQNQAWKEQCQRLEKAKNELEHDKFKQDSELRSLRSQVATMRESLAQQHRLRENMASTESIAFSELQDALQDSEKSEPILQTVFYLLNRRLHEMERATEDDLSNGLKIAFENGRCSAMRALKEDLLGLIADAGTSVETKQLGETRIPFRSKPQLSSQKYAQA